MHIRGVLTPFRSAAVIWSLILGNLLRKFLMFLAASNPLDKFGVKAKELAMDPELNIRA